MIEVDLAKVLVGCALMCFIMFAVGFWLGYIFLRGPAKQPKKERQGHGYLVMRHGCVRCECQTPFSCTCVGKCLSDVRMTCVIGQSGCTSPDECQKADWCAARARPEMAGKEKPCCDTPSLCRVAGKCLSEPANTCVAADGCTSPDICKHWCIARARPKTAEKEKPVAVAVATVQWGDGYCICATSAHCVNLGKCRKPDNFRRFG